MSVGNIQEVQEQLNNLRDQIELYEEDEDQILEERDKILKEKADQLNTLEERLIKCTSKITTLKQQYDELSQKLMNTQPTESLVEKAMLFAVKSHRGQKRKGSCLPYIVHPLAVGNYIRFYIQQPIGKLSVDELIVCAYLHDTMEDCNVSYDEIHKLFGSNVANVVKELTNNNEQIQRIGKEKYITTKLLTMSVDALAVKLCDRLDNLQDSFGVYFTKEKKAEIVKTNLNIFETFMKRDKLPKELLVIRDDIRTILNKNIGI